MPAVGLDAADSSSDGLFSFLHERLHAEAPWFAMQDEPPGSKGWLYATGDRELAEIQVLASVFPTGPKLVDVSEKVRRAVRGTHEIRLLPNLLHDAMSMYPGPAPSPALSGSVCTVQVLDNGTQLPIAGAKVTLFESVANAVGDSGTSDISGLVSLQVSGIPFFAEHLYVEPPPVGYWGRHFANLSFTSQTYAYLEPVGGTPTDLARALYSSWSQHGAGVRIGIVDSGIDPGEVPVAGGLNCVLGESDTDHSDNGTGHGTHIAGIIANSQNGAPSGLAPSAEIFSFRAMAANTTKFASFPMMNGVTEAVRHGCHLINLSLGNLPRDDALRDTAAWAVEHGAVLLAAAGNDWGGTVTVPASLPDTLAIAALGRDGTYPSGSLEEAHIGPRSATTPSDYLTSFCNTSPSNTIDLIAPGAGILSVRPGGGYGPLSGTSQACAVATGAAARALTNSSLLTASPDKARSDAMKNHLLTSAQSVGLAMDYEGNGLLP